MTASTTKTFTLPLAGMVFGASLFMATAGAIAQEPSMAERAGTAASSALTKTGHAIHRGASKTADVVEDGASSAGHAIHRGASKTGDAIAGGAESASATTKRTVRRAHKAMHASSSASE